ncbi:MAG: RNA pseudouridine synthase, partial [Hungatella sp.]
MKQQFTVLPEQQGIRIDRYLTDACETLSRSYLQKLLKTEAVQVNGEPV